MKINSDIFSGAALFVSFFICIISIFTMGYENTTVLAFLEQKNVRYVAFAIAMLVLIADVYYRPVWAMSGPQYLLGSSLILLLTSVFVISDKHGISDILRLVILFPFMRVNEVDGRFLRIRFGQYLYLVPILMMCYSVYFGVFHQGRYIFSSNDPNFSAVYIMMGFMMADKLALRPLQVIFVVMGLMTGSRNFILFIFVFYFVRHTQGFLVLRVLYERINPLIVFLLMQLFVVLLGSYMLLCVNFNGGRSLAGLADGSNYLRFLYTDQGLDYLHNEKEAIWEGAGAKYWSVEKGGTGAAGTKGSVHNSYLSLMVEKGIVYGVLNLFVIFMVVNRSRQRGYEYIYPFLVVTLFLGGLFSGVYLFMWAFVLSVDKTEGNTLLENKSIV